MPNRSLHVQHVLWDKTKSKLIWFILTQDTLPHNSFRTATSIKAGNELLAVKWVIMETSVFPLFAFPVQWTVRSLWGGWVRSSKQNMFHSSSPLGSSGISFLSAQRRKPCQNSRTGCTCKITRKQAEFICGDHRGRITEQPRWQQRETYQAWIWSNNTVDSTRVTGLGNSPVESCPGSIPSLCRQWQGITKSEWVLTSSSLRIN